MTFEPRGGFKDVLVIYGWFSFRTRCLAPLDPVLETGAGTEANSRKWKESRRLGGGRYGKETLEGTFGVNSS